MNDAKARPSSSKGTGGAGRPKNKHGGAAGGARKEQTGQREADRTPLPPGHDLRALCADLLSLVRKGELLDGLLEAGPLSQRFNALETKDRALVRAIIGTALRRHGQIAEAIAACLDRPLPQKAGALQSILAIGAAQVLFMDVADHAAIDIAVELAGRSRDTAKWKGLTNAILRRLQRERDAILARQDEARLNTPDWLFEAWAKAYGTDTARAIAAMHLVEPSLDISVKSDPEGWQEKLGGKLLPTGSIRLVAAGGVDQLPGYAEGAWWVQDAAAALPPMLLGDVAGKSVADLCAAPGGKTALLAARGAHVTAVDLSARRLKRLSANLDRLGLSAEVVTADVATYAGGPFDAVLLDAPCSATGTIRRHPDLVLLKEPSDIEILAATQARLLHHAVDLVRPGGLLVYCTCSLQPEEGAAQIDALIASGAPVERVPVRPEEIGGLAEAITPAGDLRTLPSMLPDPDPHLAGLDGFFVARLRRL